MRQVYISMLSVSSSGEKKTWTTEKLANKDGHGTISRHSCEVETDVVQAIFAVMACIVRFWLRLLPPSLPPSFLPSTKTSGKIRMLQRLITKLYPRNIASTLRLHCSSFPVKWIILVPLKKITDDMTHLLRHRYRSSAEALHSLQRTTHRRAISPNRAIIPINFWCSLGSARQSGMWNRSVRMLTPKPPSDPWREVFFSIVWPRASLPYGAHWVCQEVKVLDTMGSSVFFWNWTRRTLVTFSISTSPFGLSASASPLR